jgi:hypothetical protein
MLPPFKGIIQGDRYRFYPTSRPPKVRNETDDSMSAFDKRTRESNIAPIEIVISHAIDMPKRSNEKRLILVTGATGAQGGAVIRHLREKGYPVRALTRDLDKPQARALIDQPGVEIARGDYEDKPSLLSALEDVYGVFSVQTPYESGVEAEIRQGVALIDAAHRSEIKHFIYSSVGSADQNTGIPHFDSKWKIEDTFEELGCPTRLCVRCTLWRTGCA